MQSPQTGARKALTFVASIALALGSTVGFSSVAQASDAGKVFLSFETGDTVGATVAAFEGGGGAIISSTNLTGKAFEFTKSGQAWSGMNLVTATSTAFHYADASHTTITLDYFSNDTAASPVMLKLETVVPGWQGGPSVAKTLEAQPGLNHLSFDMSTGTGWDATKEWVVAALFPDFGADDAGYKGAGALAVASQKYEIDNVSFNGATSADVIAPPAGAAANSTVLTFESDDANGALVVGDATGAKPQGSFAGSVTTIESAPAGGNGGKALKIVKNGEVYAGINAVKVDSSLRITDAAHPVVSFNYYSPKANSPLHVELAPWPNAFGTDVTAALGWQKISIDFSKVAGWSADTLYTSIGIFPDFNVAADGGAYYVDNLSFNGATAPEIVVPKAATSTLLTWESSDALGALIVGAATGAKAQGGFEGAETSIAAAPAGGNGGNALKIVKKTGGATYAGVNMLIGADFRITDSGHKVVTFNYYSPKANSPVRVELVPWPTALGMSINAVQGWQTLSFDLSTATGNNGAAWSADTEYVNLVLFPDFNATADDSVYYVDNFAINGATTPAIPVAPATVAPAMTKAATVSGTATVGKTLTVAKGTWTGNPAPTFVYSWYRCTVTGKAAVAAPTSAMKCSVIAKATAATYKLVAADKGKYVRALVKATNSKGSKYALTASTGKVG